MVDLNFHRIAGPATTTEVALKVPSLGQKVQNLRNTASSEFASITAYYPLAAAYWVMAASSFISYFYVAGLLIMVVMLIIIVFMINGIG